MMKRGLLYLLIMSGVVAASMVIMNFMYFRETVTLFTSINVVAAFMFAFPIILVKYSDYKRVKEMEEMFPIFLRDFVGTIRGGMTVPHAFKSVSKNDYKGLTPYIKKMSAQMNWGITVDKVLLNFSKQSKSKLISRIISSVIESHRFGGNLANTFEALSNTSFEVEKLRQERMLYLQGQMMTGYIVFFVFLSVIIGLEKFLVPTLASISTAEIGGAPIQQEQLVNEYKVIFRNLITIQGLFAGLTVGKMAEGSMISGIKHSMFMIFVGIIVFLVSSGIS